MELNLPAETVLVGVVGRLTPWKGHTLFLEAAAQVIQSGRQCHFVIVGESIDPVTGPTPYRGTLEAMTANLNLQQQVTFLGFRRDVPNVMRGLDILVVPSMRPEPFGLVAIEGMACARPVAAARIGGLPEIVVDGVTGRLFRPGEAADLAEALCDLADHPELRAQYGKAGRERAENLFSLDRYVASMAAVFQQAACQDYP